MQHACSWLRPLAFDWQVVCFSVASCWTVPIPAGVETRGEADRPLFSPLPVLFTSLCFAFYFTLPSPSFSLFFPFFFPLHNFPLFIFYSIFTLRLKVLIKTGPFGLQLQSFIYLFIYWFLGGFILYLYLSIYTHVCVCVCTSRIVVYQFCSK